MEHFLLVEEIENQITQYHINGNIGSKSKILFALTKKHSSLVHQMPKEKLLETCEQLLHKAQTSESNQYCLSLISINWAQSLKFLFTEEDFAILEGWAKSLITNKLVCDDFALSIMGEFVIAYPDFLPDILQWSRSTKWQVRRMAAATMVYCIRRRYFYREVFITANNLRNDKVCEVREGFRWLLREAFQMCLRSVQNYVRHHEEDIDPKFAHEIFNG